MSEPLFPQLAKAIRDDRPVALATLLDGEAAGAKLLVHERGARGSLGSPELSAAVEAEARSMLERGETALRSYGTGGGPLGAQARVFIQSFTPKPQMYVLGAIDFARALAQIAKLLNFRVTIVDARPVFADERRFPEADRIVCAWPDEFLASAPVNAQTAVVVLTHDLKFDVPAIRAALARNAGYIGVMGSRRTHAERLEALRAAGVAESDLERICAPVGLDIGARSPHEMAVSILAEIVALRAGRTGARLSATTNPIHPSRGAVR